MRPYPALTAAVLLASCSLPAGRPGTHLMAEYDELESCTVVIANVFTLGPRAGRSRFTLDAHVPVRDSAPRAPIDRVMFTFRAEQDSDVGTLDSQLTLLLDDSVRLEYRGRPSRPFPTQHRRGGVTERVHFWIPTPDLLRMARATRIAGATAYGGFTLGARQIGVLREFADFATHSPGAPVPRPGGQMLFDCDSYGIFGPRIEPGQ